MSAAEQKKEFQELVGGIFHNTVTIKAHPLFSSKLLYRHRTLIPNTMYYCNKPLGDPPYISSEQGGLGL